MRKLDFEVSLCMFVHLSLSLSRRSKYFVGSLLFWFAHIFSRKPERCVFLFTAVLTLRVTVVFDCTPSSSMRVVSFDIDFALFLLLLPLSCLPFSFLFLFLFFFLAIFPHRVKLMMVVPVVVMLPSFSVQSFGEGDHHRVVAAVSSFLFPFL